MGDLEASQTRSVSERRIFSNSSSFDFADLHDDTPSTSLGTSPELRSGSSPFLQAQTPNTSSNTLKPLEADFKRYPTLGNGETCESCALSLPSDTSSRLPAGAPGSPKANGIGVNGSPILRSRESLQIRSSSNASSDADTDDEDEQRLHQLNQQQHSSPDSFTSSTSTSSFFHKHTLTYISTSSPLDPPTYSTVRRATIHTMSREQLPRGQTAGQLAFGDPVNGYTIAYKFRLSDPHARGGHRKYALMALVGDERRACQATTFIWARFQYIAASIIDRTEEKAQLDKGPGQRGDENVKGSAMPVASFLTGRMTDPDGFLRHGGARQKARGLGDMVGDEKFFAELHLDFIGLLRDLRWRFGG